MYYLNPTQNEKNMKNILIIIPLSTRITRYCWISFLKFFLSTNFKEKSHDNDMLVKIHNYLKMSWNVYTSDAAQAPPAAPTACWVGAFCCAANSLFFPKSSKAPEKLVRKVRNVMTRTLLTSAVNSRFIIKIPKDLYRWKQKDKKCTIN